MTPFIRFETEGFQPCYHFRNPIQRVDHARLPIEGLPWVPLQVWNVLVVLNRVEQVQPQDQHDLLSKEQLESLQPM